MKTFDIAAYINRPKVSELRKEVVIPMPVLDDSGYDTGTLEDVTFLISPLSDAETAVVSVSVGSVSDNDKPFSEKVTKYEECICKMIVEHTYNPVTKEKEFTDEKFHYNNMNAEEFVKDCFPFVAKENLFSEIIRYTHEGERFARVDEAKKL
jgi:hypothetical protein